MTYNITNLSKCSNQRNSAVGDVPKEWTVLRAKNLFSERKDLSSDGNEELLSASHITGITKRSDKNIGMFLAESNEGYKLVLKGDAVINTMWAWMGAMGVSALDGLISPSYGVYRPISKDVNARYFDYLFRSKPFIAEVNRRSKGVWSSRLRLYPDDFLNLRLPLPSIQAQGAIADFLDREIVRIDHLIGKKEQLLRGISKRIEALLDQAISDQNVPRVRFGNLAFRVQRPVALSEHEELVRLGLYNRGRGIFKKAATDEEGMGDSDFFFVSAGDLILSGQFAWEGAVALATSNEEDCVVSHRYPVYRGKASVRTAYLLGLFRSSFGDFILNEASRGSAGRNKPLNTWRLSKEKIPIPGQELQSRVESAVIFEGRLREKTELSITRLREYRFALITAAITGQIDVTTWSRRGEADRRLDTFEEAMG